MQKYWRVEVGIVVGVMGDGKLSSLSKHPLSSASLVSVPYIRLPKTRTKDVVSMHECYTYFLLMLSMACKCFFGFSINDIKRGGVRAGDGGALEAVFFRRRIFQVLRERHTVSTAGTTNV